jgi:hypothetical protein
MCRDYATAVVRERRIGCSSLTFPTIFRIDKVNQEKVPDGRSAETDYVGIGWPITGRKLDLAIERIYESARGTGVLGCRSTTSRFRSAVPLEVRVSWGEQVGVGQVGLLETDHGWGRGGDRPRNSGNGIGSTATSAWHPDQPRPTRHRPAASHRSRLRCARARFPAVTRGAR